MSIDAASIMTIKVAAAGPDDTVAQVARLLAMNQISATPYATRRGTCSVC